VRRSGVTLAEVVLAVALVALPVAGMAGLLQSNAVSAKSAEDSITTQLILHDLLDVLETVDVAALRTLSHQGPGWLKTFLVWRAERLPLSERERYCHQLDALRANVYLTLEEKVDDLEDLVRITLTARRQLGAPIVLRRLVRTLEQPVAPGGQKS
jgi:hypothetical protein